MSCAVEADSGDGGSDEALSQPDSPRSSVEGGVLPGDADEGVGAWTRVLEPVLCTPSGFVSRMELNPAMQAIVDEYQRGHGPLRAVHVHPAHVTQVHWEWFRTIVGGVAAKDVRHVETLPYLFVPFAAVLLNPPWAFYATTADLLHHVPLSTLFPTSGLALLWCPRFMLHDAVRAFEGEGFEFGDSLTVLAYHPSSSATSSNSSTMSSGNTQPSNLAASHVDCLLPDSHARRTSLTLLLFKKRVPRAALFHQRNADVMEVWDGAEFGSGPREGSVYPNGTVWTPPPVLDLLETMVPVGRLLYVDWSSSEGGASNARDTMLNEKRRRWVCIFPQTTRISEGVVERK